MIISEKKILIIGGGTMAEAVIKGVLAEQVTDAGQITVSEANRDRRSWISEEYGIRTVEPEKLDISAADIILLAVKPDALDGVLERIGTVVTPAQLVISLAAGVPLARVQRKVNSGVPVMRVMPNAPAVVRRGMIAVARGGNATDTDVLLTRSILSTIGLVIDIDEAQMDIFTAISGSGPAYVLYLMEAMIAAAEQHGLSPQRALTVVAETMRGTGELAARMHENPRGMREHLASPGGPTEAAIAILDAADMKAVITRAIDTAAERVRQSTT